MGDGDGDGGVVGLAVVVVTVEDVGDGDDDDNDDDCTLLLVSVFLMKLELQAAIPIFLYLFLMPLLFAVEGTVLVIVGGGGREMTSVLDVLVVEPILLLQVLQYYCLSCSCLVMKLFASTTVTYCIIIYVTPFCGSSYS